MLWYLVMVIAATGVHVLSHERGFQQEATCQLVGDQVKQRAGDQVREVYCVMRIKERP